MAFFTLLHSSSKRGSKARTGTLQTAHGTVKTPAFVSVGTKATVKSLTPAQAQEIGTQLSFVNTYHLVVHPGSDVVRSHGSVHTFSHMNWSLMSDSGGFQVFSLAQRARRAKLRNSSEEAMLVSLSEDRVVFRSVFDGSLIEFSPEISIAHQHRIGADMIMSFDECTYYPATHEYAQKAMERTHHWLERCIVAHAKTEQSYPQYLYGIIQGATYEDLRIASAKYVCAQETAGVAIGGVSVGETKRELREQVEWVSPYLPSDRPVHLLGVGHIDDIIDLVSRGIDTFDCVEPSRLARLGVLLFVDHLEKPISEWCIRQIDITELSYKKNNYPLQSYSLYVGQFTYGYMHHLFKQKELLGYTLATLHNLALMEALMKRIREEIERNNI